MRIAVTLASCVIVGLLSTSAPGSAVDAEGRRMAALVEKIGPVLTTVHFAVIRKQGDQTRRVAGTVRGIVVDAKGLVMTIGEIYPRTADRVVGTATVNPPTEIKVILHDGSKVDATFVGKDYDLNVAFVRMNTVPEGIAPLSLAEKGALEMGQSVTIFGLLPKHYGRKVWFLPVRVAGTITEPRELYFASGQIGRILGGPAMDADGRMVGVVALDSRNVRPENDPTAPLRRVATAVIVPAWDLAPVIAKPPTVRPARQDGWLGISMDAVTKDLAEALDLPVTAGVMVSRVYPGTPAFKGGLKAEDIIVSADGKGVTVSSQDDLVEFRKQVVAAGAGAKMKFGIYRGGKRMDVTVTLAATPKSAEEAERVKLDDFGFTAREILFIDTIQPGRQPGLTGVVVAKVESAGWAALGGLRPGDIIQRVSELPVERIAQFRTHIKTIRNGKPKEVVFFIRRGPETAFIRVEPQWK